jgi:hypothetical protein
VGYADAMPTIDPLLHYPLRVACQSTTRADAERARAVRCQVIYDRAAPLRKSDDPDVAKLAAMTCLLAAELGGLAAASSATHQQSAHLATCLLTHAEQAEARLARVERRPWWRFW